MLEPGLEALSLQTCRVPLLWLPDPQRAGLKRGKGCCGSGSRLGQRGQGHKLGHRWESTCALHCAASTGARLPGWNSCGGPRVSHFGTPTVSLDQIASCPPLLSTNGNTCLRATGSWASSDQPPQNSSVPSSGGEKRDLGAEQQQSEATSGQRDSIVSYTITFDFPPPAGMCSLLSVGNSIQNNYTGCLGPAPQKSFLPVVA